MLVQSPEGEVKVIDFREVAPSKAHQDMFKEKQSSQTVRNSNILFTNISHFSYCSHECMHAIVVQTILYTGLAV